MAQPAEPIDAVYTWVNDKWPGYAGMLASYARDKRDTSPDRTRDNLDIVRYSMRSVMRNLPDIRRIYLVTCRPQVPEWLDVTHPMIKLVHHDEIMAPEYLPTFNSFAIVSHLHLLPDVSRRFLYIEDDMLVMSPNIMAAMFAPDGRPYVHLKRMQVVPRKKLDPAKASPWNLALANAASALPEGFGAGPMRHLIHGPRIIDAAVAKAMCRDYAELIEATRRSRFRSGNNVPPEFLVSHLAVERGAAVYAERALSRQVQGYVPLENFAPLTWAQLMRAERRRPMTMTLNDNFGICPNPRVERMVRTRLARWFPDPAPWERPASK